MAIFGFKSSRPKVQAGKSRTQTPASKFQAVEIEVDGDACAAAKEAAGAKFLCDGAPLLPLEGCDRLDRCACRYVRHTDRRGEARRKSEGALPDGSQQVATAERRRDQGRRTEERDALGRHRSWVKNTWD